MNQSASLPAPDFVAPDDRKAWKRDHALLVLGNCQNSHQAVLQVRAWCVLRHIYDDLTMTEAIHANPTDLSFFSWKPAHEWDEEAESWEEFCERSVTGAVNFVSSGIVENRIAKTLLPNVHYHLETCSRAEYLEEDL